MAEPLFILCLSLSLSLTSSNLTTSSSFHQINQDLDQCTAPAGRSIVPHFTWRQCLIDL